MTYLPIFCFLPIPFLNLHEILTGGMRAGGRSALSGGIRLGRGRGGRRYSNHSTANQGPTIEQHQASYFQERSAQNPYATVPDRVNVSDYIRSYR